MRVITALHTFVVGVGVEGDAAISISVITSPVTATSAVEAAVVV
jgi:hypothetical protein